MRTSKGIRFVEVKNNEKEVTVMSDKMKEFLAGKLNDIYSSDELWDLEESGDGLDFMYGCIWLLDNDEGNKRTRLYRGE